ncbi:MAG: transposase [Gammaproteobacteria bacterium]|nr:transposase [Gammaproteobacteria bacterium]MDH4253291.1 transposase [Gammaproteobacteria bacterium]MDH5310551.1 transposase [Gammaproteobacteria bacterium]MDH5500199.1 transposase [Gammaproteobacteria bacterium]
MILAGIGRTWCPVCMTLPRYQKIDPGQTPYYHCVSRCVRRAYLCGYDTLSGRSFEHRRAWIEARLHRLARIFAIDLCAYAVMSNHYHVVLRIDVHRLKAMSHEEVIDRWTRLHRLPEGFESLSAFAQLVMIERWRSRLGSISWFMKSINEPLARGANREDGCKGRFWEGRFRSQALLDEAAVLKCMVYIDLNPVRAGIASTPEDSLHTSVKARIEHRDNALAPMAGERPTGFTLPIRRLDYIALVDATGRQWRLGRRGRIDPNLAPILARLYPAGSWVDELRHLTRRYCRAIGSIPSLLAYREALGQQRLRGLSA